MSLKTSCHIQFTAPELERLKLVYETLLGVRAHTTLDDLRNLILELDLLVASFGLGINDRELVSCSDAELVTELVLTAAPLVKVTEDLHGLLCTEIEDMLARHAPNACILYAARSKLWEVDIEAWARVMGMVLRHVKNSKAGLVITAVIAERVAGEEVADEA